jgi:hypothetical protein
MTRQGGEALIDSATLIAMPRDVRLRISDKEGRPVTCSLCGVHIDAHTPMVRLPDAGPNARHLPAHIGCAEEEGWITH